MKCSESTNAGMPCNESRAKIREALETLWNQGYEASHHLRDREHNIDEVLAILDDEDKPGRPLSDMDYEAAWGEIAYEIEHGGDPVAVLQAHFPEPARELTERFDTILMDWLNDHPRLCQRASVEDLFSLRDTLVAFAQTVARAEITKAPKGDA